MRMSSQKNSALVEYHGQTNVFYQCHPRIDSCAEAKSAHESTPLWERIRNFLRTEEPATIHQIKRWLSDVPFSDLCQILEEMRQVKAVTMQLTGEIGALTVVWWYGIHEEDSQ